MPRYAGVFFLNCSFTYFLDFTYYLEVTSARPKKTGPSAQESDILRRIRYLLDSMRAAADSRAHFGVSAAPKLIPTVAIKECIEVLDSYADEPDLAFLAVTPAYVRLKRSLHASVVSQAILTDSVKSLLNFADELISRDASSTKGPIKAYLATQANNIASSAVSALASLEEKREYVKELSTYTEQAIMGDHSNRSAFRKLQRASHEVIALVASQGRTLDLFIDLLETKLLTSEQKPRRVSGVSYCLNLRAVAHQVAVVVDGTFLTRGVTSHDFQRVDPKGKISWLNPESSSNEIPHQSNSDLARFCLRHWKIEQDHKPLAESQVDSQILILKVEAWDREQARHEALDKAEALVDLMNAEHRATGFGVKRKVAVWQEGRRIVHHLSSASPLIPKTRLLDISRSPSVDRSLRFATRAANERAGSMQTFFSWIALEYLGRGGAKKPQNLVSETVPSLIAMVALRQLVIESWYLLTRELGADNLPNKIAQIIQRGIGRNEKNQNANKFDKKKLGHLLIADAMNSEHVARLCSIPTADAIAVISELDLYKRTLSDYAQVRLATIKQILSDNAKMRSYVTGIEISVDETMQRMRFVRNQTAHTASSTSTEHMQLSTAALAIMDAVFETIPRFAGKPVEGLIKAKTLKTHWERSLAQRTDARALSFDPNRQVIM